MNPYDTCPLPDRSNQPRGGIARMLAARRIAIVGLSDDPSRPSFAVASYLRSVGKEIVPVNPNCQSVMGLKSYPSLKGICGVLDLVDVFRRAEFCPDVVRQAIEIDAKGIWLQSGIVSPDSERLAREAGIDFVQNRCIKVDHMIATNGVQEQGFFSA